MKIMNSNQGKTLQRGNISGIWQLIADLKSNSTISIKITAKTINKAISISILNINLL